MASKYVHLLVHLPCQFLLGGLRLTAGVRHLTTECGVRLEYLARRHQCDTDMHADHACLLDHHRTRRPRLLGAERVGLLTVGLVGNNRLEQDAGHYVRPCLTGSAWWQQLWLIDGIVMGELNLLPVHLITSEVLVQRLSARNSPSPSHQPAPECQPLTSTVMRCFRLSTKTTKYRQWVIVKSTHELTLQ